jgi:thymidylate kinase
LGIAYAAHMDAYEKMDPDTNYIIDRALTSCFVYQGILLENYIKNKKVFDIFIQSIHDKIVEKYERIVFYLDIDVDEIFRRRALANRVTESTTNKEDLYDNMDRTSMQRLVDAYKYSIDQQIKLFPEDDFYQINAKQKPEQILESVYDKIR